MKKIISLFCRNYDTDYLVRDEVVPGAEWVLAGEGVATRKHDGTCCLIKDGKLFKRHEVKRGKTPPEDFVPTNPVDPKTGKQQGWLPVGDGPEDKYHREALEDDISPHEKDGTYELVGPKIQGNPEGVEFYFLIRHGLAVDEDCPRDFDGIKEYLRGQDIEGIVWHHSDGRMVKIKKKDFGFKRSDTK